MRKVFVSLFVLAVLMTGCGKEAGGARTPQAVVEAVYTYCQAGEYSKAAEHMSQGPEVWNHSPNLIVTKCDELTHFGYMIRWEQVSVTEQGEGARIETQGYDDKGQRAGRRWEWTLIRKQGRWLVSGVV